MSNARSPREVCSTTIGTSGLMVLASVSLYRPDSFRTYPERVLPRLALRRPQPGRSRLSTRLALLLSGVGRPELLARLGLLERYRLGLGCDQLDRLTRGEILTDLIQASGLAEIVEQLLWLDSLTLGGGGDDFQQVVIARNDRLRRHHRGDHRFAAQRLGRLGGKLGDEIVLLAPGDLQVGLAGYAAMGEGVEHSIPHLAGLRLHERLGDLYVRACIHRVERSLAKLRGHALGIGLTESRADVIGELLDRVEAHVHGKVIVDFGKLLVLDLLDGDLERGILAGELPTGIVAGEGEIYRASLSRLGAL